MAETARPVGIAHVGITVPDLDAAIKWYEEAMGLRLVGPAGVLSVEDGGHAAYLVKEVLGSEAKRIGQAHLIGANGVAVELFSAIDPPYEEPDDNFAWRRGGPWHFCVVDPDVAGLAATIAGSGGRQRTPVLDVFEDYPYKFCYCEDPWGNIIEIYSHGHEMVYANHGAIADG